MYSLVKKPEVVLLILLITLFTACKKAEPSVDEEEIVLPRLQPKQEVNLDNKIGQMLMVGFRGTAVHDQGVQDIVRDIKQFHLGGVILYDYDVPSQSPIRNIQSPQQVKVLIEQLQTVSSLPLLIAIDQEGGKIQRLNEKFGFPPTVSAQYLGKHHPDMTDKHASEIANTLAVLGINFNFAPVVDLNINPNNPIIGKPERSFSAAPEIVTEHARAFVEAHRQYGVLCALKHFPGHGSSADDSHLGLADVTDTWQAIELEPYRHLINAGVVDAIMTAHVFNKALDPEYPATLSKRIITGTLREKLGYHGVIVSDDMQMKAIAHHYDLKSAILTAINAGIDILVLGNNVGEYEEDIAAHTFAVIRQLLDEGKLSQERIDESYHRIQALKHKL